MELFLGKSKDYKGIPSSRGATIYIYNHSTLYSDSEGIDLSVGFETRISLVKKITESLLEPYSNCVIKGDSTIDTSSVTDPEYLDLFIKLNLKYRTYDCINFCYLDMFMKSCNCLDNQFKFFNLKNLSLPRFCNFENNIDYDCWVNFNLTTNIARCSLKCPFECDSVKHSVTTSLSQYPTSNALSRLLWKPYLDMIERTGGDVASQVLKLNIFYESSSYEMLSETPSMTVVSLLGGLGGTLGKVINFGNYFFCRFNLKLRFCFVIY